MTELPMSDSLRTLATLGDERLIGSKPEAAVGKQLVAHLGNGWKLQNHAVPGATTSELRHSQLRRLFAKGTLPDAVVVSIGSSDLSTAAIVPEEFPNILARLAENVNHTLSEIRRLAPKCVILLCAIDASTVGPWPIPQDWADTANSLLVQVAEPMDIRFVESPTDLAESLATALASQP